jgi:hypothetical protein
LKARAGALEIVIFSKKGCHLCEVVEAEVRSTIATGADPTVVDIDEDLVLHDKYWLRVPVVRVGGKDVFEAKMMDRGDEWRLTLRDLVSEPSR